MSDDYFRYIIRLHKTMIRKIQIYIYNMSERLQNRTANNKARYRCSEN